MPKALVTGAGIRVGKAIALRLAESGFDLILHANRSLEPLEQVAQECRNMGREVLVLGGDLSNRADRQSWIDKVHAQTDVLDVLVNNAAIYETLPFGQISYEDWDRMLGVNLEAPFFITQGLCRC